MSDPEFEDIGISRTESTTRRAHLAPAPRARVWMKELVNRASARKKCRGRPGRPRRLEWVSLKRAARFAHVEDHRELGKLDGAATRARGKWMKRRNEPFAL